MNIIIHQTHMSRVAWWCIKQLVEHMHTREHYTSCICFFFVRDFIVPIIHLHNQNLTMLQLVSQSQTHPLLLRKLGL